MLSSSLFPVFFLMFDQFFFCFRFFELMMAACRCWLGSVSYSGLRIARGLKKVHSYGNFNWTEIVVSVYL